MPILKDILQELNRWADLRWAEDWDNPGLQVGTKEQEIKKILLALTPSTDVIEYACQNQYDLVLTHHPLIFGKLKNITDNTELGANILKLIRNNVAVASYHTNLDMATNGVNDVLAERLELKSTRGFALTGEEPYYKFVVYVPQGYEEAVRQTICDNGGGWIGAYSDCTFRSQGIGTFRAHPGTNPFLGEINSFTETTEYRLETVIPKSKLHKILQVVKAVHPYEEMAYDLFELQELSEKRYIGRVGELPYEMPVEQLLQHISRAIEQKHLSYCGELQQQIRCLAVCGGSAASYMDQAKAVGADAYLTADVKFHDYQKAQELGLVLIDGGHFCTEKSILEKMRLYLQEKFVLNEISIFEEQDFVQHYHH